MDNPFLRRATEFLRDDEAFIAVVCPEPVRFHLEKPGRNGSLYDRLVLIRGAPGCGKTTLARLFEYSTLQALQHNRNTSAHKELFSALSDCGAIEHGSPTVLGCRLPMESDFRDFWELPYTTDIRTALMTSLLQARAMLAWFRHLESSGIGAGQVTLVPRLSSSSLLDTIGGTDGISVITRAIEVERNIYKVITALVAPPEAALSELVRDNYKPFDHIQAFEIGNHPDNDEIYRLRLLVICDDAHALHPDQFKALERFLVRRELQLSRWIVARFDVLNPEEALTAATANYHDTDQYPGVTSGRDTEPILLQSSGQRRKQRDKFRGVAKDMASRYLRRMPFFNERGLITLSNLLSEERPEFPAGKLQKLQSQVDGIQNKLKISNQQRNTFEQQISGFTYGGQKANKSLSLAMLLVMMHRFNIRRARTGPSLFDNLEADDDESISVSANLSVFETARYRLFKDFEAPYYFGIDDVCDASSENAELFLRLSADLVETIAGQLVRNKSPVLSPQLQHNLLTSRATKIIEKWNFPEVNIVRKLVESISERCLLKSQEPNGAVLANAFGIPQHEFEQIGKASPKMAKALQFAVAYNAITLVPHHSCKDKEWCLLELGGVALLKYGLTLKRGGFIEGTVNALTDVIEEAPK